MNSNIQFIPLKNTSIISCINLHLDISSILEQQKVLNSQPYLSCIRLNIDFSSIKLPSFNYNTISCMNLLSTLK